MWRTPSRACTSPSSVLMSMACACSSVPCSWSTSMGSSGRPRGVVAPASRACWAAARAVTGGRALHPRDLGVAARPELDVVEGLRARDRPVLGREVDGQAVGLEPIPALRDLHPAQELQEALLLAGLRAVGRDERG